MLGVWCHLEGVLNRTGGHNNRMQIVRVKTREGHRLVGKNKLYRNKLCLCVRVYGCVRGCVCVSLLSCIMCVFDICCTERLVIYCCVSNCIVMQLNTMTNFLVWLYRPYSLNI